MHSQKHVARIQKHPNICRTHHTVDGNCPENSGHNSNNRYGIDAYRKTGPAERQLRLIGHGKKPIQQIPDCQPFDQVGSTSGKLFILCPKSQDDLRIHDQNQSGTTYDNSDQLCALVISLNELRIQVGCMQLAQPGKPCLHDRANQNIQPARHNGAKRIITKLREGQQPREQNFVNLRKQ